MASSRAERRPQNRTLIATFVTLGLLVGADAATAADRPGSGAALEGAGGPSAEKEAKGIGDRCRGGSLSASPGRVSVGARKERVVVRVRDETGDGVAGARVVLVGKGPDRSRRRGRSDDRGRAGFGIRSDTRRQRWLARVAPCKLTKVIRSRNEMSLPAVAHSRVAEVRVHRRPRGSSARMTTMKRFRFDYRRTLFHVIERRIGRRGDPWLRIHVPGRPNGRRGWVRAGRLELTRSVAGMRVVIDRSEKRLVLKRRSRTVLSAPVAVGKPSAPTPIGDFYVTAAFRPGDSFLGPWGFETSAYSAITDWPRGGIVGLHGTSAPSSVGTQASHGCVRVHNSVIRKLKKRVRPGTPLTIKR